MNSLNDDPVNQRVVIEIHASLAQPRDRPGAASRKIRRTDLQTVCRTLTIARGKPTSTAITKASSRVQVRGKTAGIDVYGLPRRSE